VFLTTYLEDLAEMLTVKWKVVLRYVVCAFVDLPRCCDSVNVTVLNVA